MREWVAFWNRENSIYVNARHKDAHYLTIAHDLIGYIPHPEARVLDYGCGEALHAHRVAAKAGALVLADAAPSVRAALEERYRDEPKITVIAPEALEGAGPFDLIVMNSVAQYLARDEFSELLRRFRALLSPSGTLVLGDIVPPGVSPLSDARALLRFAARHGFLGAALAGLARTVASDYSKLRTRVGLTVYDEEQLRALLAQAGFSARRAPENTGYNTHRMTFIAS